MSRFTRKTVSTVAAATALALVAGSAAAHGPRQGAAGGMMMGPGGVMGQPPFAGNVAGQPGYGPGYGMMGYGMRPGMMGHHPMMGAGMMGPGYGYGPGMGMGQGFGPCGQAAANGAEEDIGADDVTARLERWLAIQGNDRLQLGKVVEVDDDTITAEIVTVDGSLVQKLTVDRHTGWTRPAK